MRVSEWTASDGTVSSGPLSGARRAAALALVGLAQALTSAHQREGRVRLPYSQLTATVAAVKWQLSHPWNTRRNIVPHVPVSLTATD